MDANSVNVLSEQRVRLDSILNRMKEFPKSRGTAAAITSVEKGRMYIGEILGVLGKEYPYNKTKDATTAEDIQEATDKSTVVLEVVGNEVVDLNTIREVLQNEVDSFLEEVFNDKHNNLVFQTTKAKFVYDCTVSEAYRGLKEGRMWLGARLGEIRDNSKR